MGAAGAGTALAKMIGRPVTTKVPELFIDRAEKIPQFVGGLDRVVTAVLLKFVGDLPGMMLLVFSPETARRVAGLLTESHKKPLPVLDEIDRSALREAGNVLSGTFMNVLSKFLNLDLLQSVPDTATDRLGSVLDAVLVEMAQTSELALAVRVDCHYRGNFQHKR
jgi:chemotaxis protein CheC